MTEIQSHPKALAFFMQTFDVQRYGLGFEWYLGVTGSEVSPHLDAHRKLGTHIFYFNKRSDWKAEWGGSILVLEGCKKQVMNPEFEDFEKIISVDIVDNHSFLFKNIPTSWHGVKPLTSPEEKFRRLFNIIFINLD